MQRFFLPSSSKKDQIITICDKNTVNQISRVMRSRAGDKIICLFNDGKEYEVELQEFSKKEVIGKIIEERKNTNELSKELVLFQALPKSKDKWEMIVQKAVEIGVSTIVPLQSVRVTAKYPVISERIERIIQEASEQSERGKLLEITDICKLEELEEYIFNDGLYFVGDSYDKEIKSIYELIFELKNCSNNEKINSSNLDQTIYSFNDTINYSKTDQKNRSNIVQNISSEIAQKSSSKSVQKSESKKELNIYSKIDLNNCSKIGVFIGPEGGFSQEEVYFLNKQEVYSVSLGKRILRLETAAIVSLGVLVGLCEKED